MAGQFHTAVFNVFSDQLRAEMTIWLTEQSAAGWEPISVMLTDAKQAQVLVVLRREIDQAHS
jgi:hypothetical protein